VGFPIDHLKVWQAPKAEQLWLRKTAVFGQNTKQREPVINFGISASFATATRLETVQQLRLAMGLGWLIVIAVLVLAIDREYVFFIAREPRLTVFFVPKLTGMSWYFSSKIHQSSSIVLETE
jgi:hypothetical protein